MDWNIWWLIKTKERDVTPFVGVWIETDYGYNSYKDVESHTLRGCVDWNRRYPAMNSSRTSHTLRGCVDINEWIKCRRIWMKRWFVGISDRPLTWCFRGKNAEQRCEILQSWCYYLCGVSCKIYLRYMFRLFQLSDSVPSLAGFVSFGHRIRFLRSSYSTPSATGFDSFC